MSDGSADADAAETIAKLTGEEGGLPEATALGHRRRPRQPRSSTSASNTPPT